MTLKEILVSNMELWQIKKLREIIIEFSEILQIVGSGYNLNHFYDFIKTFFRFKVFYRLSNVQYNSPIIHGISTFNVHQLFSLQEFSSGQLKHFVYFN